MEADRVAEQYVFLVDLARYLKRSPEGLREKVRKCGIKIVTRRRPLSAQASLAISAEDAARIRAMEAPSADIIRPEDLFGDKAPETANVISPEEITKG
jgi:hypothetical protein